MILESKGNVSSFEEKFHFAIGVARMTKFIGGGAKLIVQASLVPLLSYTKCWEQLHPSLSTVIS